MKRIIKELIKLKKEWNENKKEEEQLLKDIMSDLGCDWEEACSLLNQDEVSIN